MPTTKKVGSPGPANEKIGGVPTIHYFDFQSRGRGQVVRLMWEVKFFPSLPPYHPTARSRSPLLSSTPSPPKLISPLTSSPNHTQDAGIAYEDVRYTFEEYPDVKTPRSSNSTQQATSPSSS